MIHDTLDDLLDRSAPASRPAAQGDLDAMIAEAFQSAPRTVRPRILIAAGLAAVFASGGVGIAAATDGFSWAPWAQEPIGAVQFTMTTGFQCELRFSEYTSGSDPAYVEKVNSILENWYRSTDVLAAVEAIVPTNSWISDQSSCSLAKPSNHCHRVRLSIENGPDSGWPGTSRSAMRSGSSSQATASNPATSALVEVSEAARSSVSMRTTSRMRPGPGRETRARADHDSAE